MNTHLKILIAASSAAVLAMAATLQGCSSNDDSAGSSDTAGTSGATTAAGATSTAGADTSSAGTTSAGSGGADTSSAGTPSAGTGGTDTSGAGTGGASAGSGGASAGSGGSSAGAGGATATTFTVQTSTLGQVLATAAGHTLYLFKTDTPSTTAPVSTCDSNCQTTWPVYYGNPLSVPDSLSATDFSSFSNGSAMQSTYMGWPLYTFASDANPGDVIGDESASSGSWLAVKIPFTAPN